MWAEENKGSRPPASSKAVILSFRQGHFLESAVAVVVLATEEQPWLPFLVWAARGQDATSEFLEQEGARCQNSVGGPRPPSLFASLLAFLGCDYVQMHSQRDGL